MPCRCCVLFLAKQEILLYGYDQSHNSVKRGNYTELLYLLSQYDSLLATHLEKSATFCGISLVIQNDLIATVSSVLLERIKMRLENFVILITNKTSQIIQVTTFNCLCY